MADLFHNFGQDLISGPTGDLSTVDGTVRGQQRVLRRLLTSPGSYIWHPTYGAGLPTYIGQAFDARAVAAVVRAQLLLESCVAQSPAPVVSAQPITNGIAVSISYVDSVSGKPVTLSFDVNA